MTLKVGLTGGIASGKSTIRRNLESLGCTTIDADTLVHELYRPGRAGYEALVRTYGNTVLNPAGEIVRQRLADIAFATPESAKQLNALIHPIVIAEQARLAPDEGIYVVEATLLLESGGRQRFDRIVVVDVLPEVQIDRAISRGMTREEVTRRMTNQMPREERLRQADYILDNSGDLAHGLAETRRVHALLLRDLAQKEKGEPLGPALS